MITIYHKPNCSTSRTVLDLLKKHTKEEINIVKFLEDVPTQKELKALIKMLGIRAEELVRKKEPLYKEHYEGKKITAAEWIMILNKNPILIERPIIVKGARAIIGRPADSVLPFVNKK